MRADRTARFLLVALVASLAACSFTRELRREISERIDAPAELTGTVAGPEEGGRVIVVLLQQGERGKEEIAQCAVLPRPGAFSFLARSGTYRLFAFADRNRDQALERDEPAAWHGPPASLRAKAGAQLQGLDITLPREGGRGAGDPLAAYDSAPEELRRCASRVHAGDVADLREERFSDGPGNQGLWDPVEFEREHGMGLWMLQPYDPARVPVLFVHGAAGYPQEWSYLASSLDAARFQPWVFHYASGARLDALADRLADAVAELRARYGFSRLVLVAHSMGGLVSRAALPRIEDRCGAHLVKLFVTISTPWGGHDAARLGVRHSPFVIPSWKDMAPKSAFLGALRTRPLRPDVAYHLFFGYRGGETILMRENSDEAVTLKSMLDRPAQEEAVRIHGFFEDHDSILKSGEVAATLNRLLADAAADPVAR
jgi:pimeloyl-ACP methyl ester carboxylesterase